MKKLTAAFACAFAMTFTATAAAVDVGANDDTGKYSGDGGAVFFGQMAGAGLKQNVMTVRWKPSDPLTIPDQEALDRAVPLAIAAGVKVLFAVYPYPPSEIEGGAVSPAAFATWLGALAQRYPQVTTYIVGNEPNLNTFWRPQGNGAGQILSGATFGPFLAAGYDALKAVSPANTVLGVGLSPRGSRDPAAAGKTSPVHFLNSLGNWYRSSNRMTPLMDGFSFHPYPNPSNFTVPFSFTYGWPNASAQELGRIKQGLWDAFNGTPQTTTVSGLKLYLDEVGWQVTTDGNPAYADAENVKVTSELSQAAIYAELIRFVACDPDVAQLNFFGYYDERSRLGWQSALRRTDGTERASNAAVAAAIVATGGGCLGLLRSWTPSLKPEAASVVFESYPKGRTKDKKTYSFTPTAAEDIVVRSLIVKRGTSAAGALAKLTGVLVDANRQPPQKLSKRITTPGTYVLAVSVTPRLAPKRVQLFTSRPFRITR
ncbi:MAG TPA: hypothetical protein VNI55_12390 [Gaiellaceae bacterium]|nr:hypothetical protein [Gaiellaceae bacterium]